MMRMNACLYTYSYSLYILPALHIITNIKCSVYLVETTRTFTILVLVFCSIRTCDKRISVILVDNFTAVTNHYIISLAKTIK